MVVAKEQYVVDEHGNRTAVLLDIDRYFALLEAQEELDSIRAYDAAKATSDEAIPFAQAASEIEGANEVIGVMSIHKAMCRIPRC